MHAVILAAGFNRRLEVETPKALLPMGRGTVIDHVIGQVAHDRISCIHIVHNDRRPRKTPPTSRLFNQWKKTIIWTPSPQRWEMPYIRLHNNGIQHDADLLGSVGDLDFVIQKQGLDKLEMGIVVACADNVWVNPADSMALVDQRASAVTVRETQEIDASDLGKFTVSGGMVINGGRSGNAVFAGPFYLSSRAVSLVRKYCDLAEKAETKPDDLGAFLSWLVFEKEPLRAVWAGGPFFDVGTKRSYDMARIWVKTGRVA